MNKTKRGVILNGDIFFYDKSFWGNFWSRCYVMIQRVK